MAACIVWRCTRPALAFGTCDQHYAPEGDALNADEWADPDTLRAFGHVALADVLTEGLTLAEVAALTA